MFFIIELLTTIIAYISFETKFNFFISLFSLCIFTIMFALLITNKKNEKIIVFSFMTALLIILSLVTLLGIINNTISNIITCFCGITALYAMRDYILAIMIRRNYNDKRNK